MNSTLIEYHTILKDLSTRYQDVTEGRMMSSAAIQYKSKVFCCLKGEQMVFKIGRETDLKTEFNIDSYEMLSPFQSKPPMKDWFIVSNQFQDQWAQLAEQSLLKMIKS